MNVYSPFCGSFLTASFLYYKLDNYTNYTYKKKYKEGTKILTFPYKM